VGLKQRIDADLKTALLTGNRFDSEVLRGLKAAILNEEVAKSMRDEGLDESSIEQLVAREIKKRNDSASQYEQADRSELSETERQEAGVLAIYLPEQASEADIAAAVDKAIVTTRATTMAQMGQVIGTVKAELGNSADGALIARLVKDALQ
jgi:uncharacterized protein YqeY